MQYKPLPTSNHPTSKIQNIMPLTMTVQSPKTGTQMVRVSVPFPEQLFLEGKTLRVIHKEFVIEPEIRMLSFHPGTPKSIRRALITFPFTFHTKEPYQFIIQPNEDETFVHKEITQIYTMDYEDFCGDYHLQIQPTKIIIKEAGQVCWELQPLVPVRQSRAVPLVEIIESHQYVQWVRMIVPDDRYPYILEAKVDALGTFGVKLHLQQGSEEKTAVFAPTTGWKVAGPAFSVVKHGEESHPLNSHPDQYDCSEGKASWLTGECYELFFPDAEKLGRGYIQTHQANGNSYITYVRSVKDSRIPLQATAWIHTQITGNPKFVLPWNDLWESEMSIHIPPAIYNAVYHSGDPIQLLDSPEMNACYSFHHNILFDMVESGDDYGNMVNFGKNRYPPMNRLNHLPTILWEAYRSQDIRLRNLAVRWADNYQRLTIWWGKKNHAGTRYPTVTDWHPPFQADPYFTWRSHSGVDYCTKGIDSFIYIYEETGDPRYLASFHAQMDFAESIRVDTGQTRNIGIVADYVKIYEITGVSVYLDRALELFRQLVPLLTEEGLFTQSGDPVASLIPFINEDETGYQYPFPKPYILGYALIALPLLYKHCPDEPELKNCIVGIADFLCDSQDPIGSWRYPHPASSTFIISQAIEYCWHLVKVAQYVEEKPEYLDAIEAYLRLVYHYWKKQGTLIHLMHGWEKAAGILGEDHSIYDLYKFPEDRDPTRDYSEGIIDEGGSLESVIYFYEVLQFYKAHRPLTRIYQLPEPGTPLAILINRS